MSLLHVHEHTERRDFEICAQAMQTKDDKARVSGSICWTSPCVADGFSINDECVPVVIQDNPRF